MMKIIGFLIIFLVHAAHGETLSEKFMKEITDSNDFLRAISPIFLPTVTVLGIVDTTISPFNSKKVVNSKNDALFYVASDGLKYHTAKLELAFRYIKIYYPNASNLEIAKAIILN